MARLIRAMGDPSVPRWIKVLPLLALAYILLPIDFVPDFAVVIGWLDDILIAGALISRAMHGLDRLRCRALPQ